MDLTTVLANLGQFPVTFDSHHRQQLTSSILLLHECLEFAAIVAGSIAADNVKKLGLPISDAIWTVMGGPPWLNTLNTPWFATRAAAKACCDITPIGKPSIDEGIRVGIHYLVTKAVSRCKTVQDVTDKSSQATAKLVIKHRPDIARAVSQVKHTVKKFHASPVIITLLGADLWHVMPMIRQFYLYSIWDMIQLCPFDRTLITTLAERVDLYHAEPVFTARMADLTQHSDLSSAMTLGGPGQRSIYQLIAEYAAWLLKPEEIMQMLQL